MSWNYRIMNHDTGQVQHYSIIRAFYDWDGKAFDYLDVDNPDLTLYDNTDQAMYAYRKLTGEDINPDVLLKSDIGNYRNSQNEIGPIPSSVFNGFLGILDRLMKKSQAVISPDDPLWKESVTLRDKLVLILGPLKKS